jgi:hypothetical protein
MCRENFREENTQMNNIDLENNEEINGDLNLFSMGKFLFLINVYLDQ